MFTFTIKHVPSNRLISVVCDSLKDIDGVIAFIAETEGNQVSEYQVCV